MWRKPDAKPSSDVPNNGGSTPLRTLSPSVTQTQQSSFQRAAGAASTSYLSADSVPADATRIGAGLKIRGEISGSSDVYLDGEATGKIRITGARITIGPKGRVQADLDAKEIVVNGSVQGNLKADARLRLGSSSQVEGALAAPSVGIEDGARFRGKVEVTRSKPGRAAPETETASDKELLKPVGAHAEVE